MNKKMFYGIGVLAILIIVPFFIVTNSNNPSNSDIFSNLSNLSNLENSIIQEEIQKTYEGELSELIISTEILPEGYEIAERSPRVKSEMNEYALNLGWEDGYYVRYVKQGEGLFDVSRIELYISKYPLENISKTIEDGGQDYEGYTKEALPTPKIGEDSIATRYTDEELGFRGYEIEFYKKDIYMSLSNSGVSTDYETLKSIGKQLIEKI